MGRVRGAVNARALRRALRARRLIFATAGGEKPPPNVSQVELVSFAEDPVMVVATL